MNYCRAMLHIHGVLPDAENEKMKARIQKYCDKRDKGRGEK